MAPPDKTPQTKPQTEQKHPPEYEQGLNPQHMAGQNIGEREPSRPASEIKDMTRCLQDFTLEELLEIPVLEPGARLKQGATYLDLRSPSREPRAGRCGVPTAPPNGNDLWIGT